MTDFSTICSSQLGIDGAKLARGIESASRIPTNGRTPPILKVTFSSLDLRREILRNAYKLKTYVTSSNEKLFIKPDLTRKQQEADKTLRTELRNRRANGESVTIKFGKIVPATGHTTRTSTGASNGSSDTDA